MTALSTGRPLNLVLNKPFKIFVYSSNILKDNLDLMDSMTDFGSWKYTRLVLRSSSFSDRVPVIKFL